MMSIAGAGLASAPIDPVFTVVTRLFSEDEEGALVTPMISSECEQHPELWRLQAESG